MRSQSVQQTFKIKPPVVKTPMKTVTIKCSLDDAGVTIWLEKSDGPTQWLIDASMILTHGMLSIDMSKVDIMDVFGDTMRLKIKGL